MKDMGILIEAAIACPERRDRASGPEVERVAEIPQEEDEGHGHSH